MRMEKKSTISLVSILSLYIIVNGLMGINPVLQKLMEAYPDQSRATIMLASTLPSLFSMIITLLIGMVVGRKIKFKTIIVIGLLCYITGGVLPFFLNETFGLIMIGRVIFGIGCGCFGCRNAVIMSMFEGDQRARILGYGMLLMNLGGILIQVVSGFLGDIGLKYSFLTYLISVLPLVLIVQFFNEPEQTQKNNSVDESSGSQKVVIDGKVWIYAIVMIVATILAYPLLSNMSSYIKFKELGTAGVSGMILSLYTVGGAIGGAFFGKIYQMSKKYIGVILFGIVAIGQAIVLYGNSITVIAIGTMIYGIGFFSIIPMFMMFTGIVSEKSSIAMSTSLIVASLQVGVFLSSYWISFIGKIYGDVLIGPYYVAFIVFGICSLIFLFIDPRPKAKEKAKEL